MSEDTIEEEYADTLTVDGDADNSARVLSAIKKAERALFAWQALCDNIDDIYSRDGYDVGGVSHVESTWADPDYDLFWASTEILKPAIYAHPPQPVVSPQFKDRRPLQNTTAEMLERVTMSAFDRGGIDETMCHVRDDLIFYNRGQLWVTLEDKDGERKLLFEHLDRKDFVHPPGRKWCDTPWVARRAWMTRKEMKARFETHSGDAYQDATLCAAASTDENYTEGAADHSRKAGVWEVWHKADNRVYWVAEGCRVMLDEGEPHLKLRGFFPCPRPAFGTIRPRTLVPVPDYTRYAGHFKKINTLTRRIYTLLDQVKLKVLIPVGGTISDAVEQAVQEDDDAVFISVPSAALIGSGSSNLMVHLPLEQVAAAITGLIEARRELFSDYDRLSGISDIMRGETEAEETLGAQRLKGQYGSVRIKEKIAELQRLARDAAQIGAEIAAEADIARAVKEIKADAEAELKAAQQKLQNAPPEEAQQQFEQAKQQIVGKYAPMLKEASEQVPIEDVMKLLRDEKARGFAFEIATDSTILTDEMEEKASRNEFLTVFTGATQGLVGLASLGEAGAKLAGEVLKFVLAPYRVGRDLDSVIDEFIDAAPQMAAAQNEQGNSEAEAALAQANLKLAEAEMQKAQAAIAKVQADTQAKHQDIQLRAAEASAKADADQKRIVLEMEDTRGSIAETAAKIDKIYAEIQLAQQKLGLEAHREQREGAMAQADMQLRQTDQQLEARDSDREASFRAQDGARADREQGFAERQGSRQEGRADRQQNYAERSGDRQMSLAEKQAAKETA
jgi:hypothetical protein